MKNFLIFFLHSELLLSGSCIPIGRVTVAMDLREDEIDASTESMATRLMNWTDLINTEINDKSKATTLDIVSSTWLANFEGATAGKENLTSIEKSTEFIKSSDNNSIFNRIKRFSFKGQCSIYLFSIVAVIVSFDVIAKCVILYRAFSNCFKQCRSDINIKPM